MEEAKEILEMLKQIMKRLDDLERGDNNPFPVFGPKGYNWQSCPVCKIDHRGTMGYVCGHSQCPTRVTC